MSVKKRKSTNTSSAGKKSTISRRAVGFFLASCLVAIPAFLVRNESGVVVNFGNFLLIMALFYWCIAWFTWLRHDGLAIFNSGALSRLFRAPAEEWIERIPLPGAEIQAGSARVEDGLPWKKEPLFAAPSATAPGSGDSGIDEDPGRKKTVAARDSKKLAVDLALAGFGAFCVSILFQYGIARLVRF